MNIPEWSTKRDNRWESSWLSRRLWRSTTFEGCSLSLTPGSIDDCKQCRQAESQIDALFKNVQVSTQSNHYHIGVADLDENIPILIALVVCEIWSQLVESSYLLEGHSEIGTSAVQILHQPKSKRTGLKMLLLITVHVNHKNNLLCFFIIVCTSSGYIACNIFWLPLSSLVESIATHVTWATCWMFKLGFQNDRAITVVSREVSKNGLLWKSHIPKFNWLINYYLSKRIRMI